MLHRGCSPGASSPVMGDSASSAGAIGAQDAAPHASFADCSTGVCGHRPAPSFTPNSQDSVSARAAPGFVPKHGRRSESHHDGLRSCLHCATTKRACDGLRPCARCVKGGREASCVDAPPNYKKILFGARASGKRRADEIFQDVVGAQGIAGQDGSAGSEAAEFGEASDTSATVTASLDPSAAASSRSAKSNGGHGPSAASPLEAAARKRARARAADPAAAGGRKTVRAATGATANRGRRPHSESVSSAASAFMMPARPSSATAVQGTMAAPKPSDDSTLAISQVSAVSDGFWDPSRPMTWDGTFGTMRSASGAYMDNYALRAAASSAAAVAPSTTMYTAGAQYMIPTGSMYPQMCMMPMPLGASLPAMPMAGMPIGAADMQMAQNAAAAAYYTSQAALAMAASAAAAAAPPMFPMFAAGQPLMYAPSGYPVLAGAAGAPIMFAAAPAVPGSQRARQEGAPDRSSSMFVQPSRSITPTQLSRPPEAPKGASKSGATASASSGAFSQSGPALDAAPLLTVPEEASSSSTDDEEASSSLLRLQSAALQLATLRPSAGPAAVEVANTTVREVPAASLEIVTQPLDVSADDKELPTLLSQVVQGEGAGPSPALFGDAY